MLLEDALRSRNNNFNLIRLMAAVSVVFYHSYTYNTKNPGIVDPITTFLNNGVDLGALAVGIFFFLSGIFVGNSCLNDPNFIRFIIRRVARILPGLFICVAVTTVIAVIFFSKQGYVGLLDRRVWTYIVENSLIHQLKIAIPIEELRIDGVYYKLADHDLNGALWTLYWESRAYALIAIVSFMAIASQRVLLGVFSVLIVVLAKIYPSAIQGYYWEFNFLNLFFSGVFLACVARHINVTYKFFIGALFYFFFMNGFAGTFGVFVSAITLSLVVGCNSIGRLGHIQKNDYSYGIYIYHVPIIQMLKMSFESIGPASLFAMTLLFVIPAAFISWHFVERPVLRWVARILKHNLTEASFRGVLFALRHRGVATDAESALPTRSATH
jgi:peptidoglycan/LPS O-acetylase OafA/YrhL